MSEDSGLIGSRVVVSRLFGDPHGGTYEGIIRSATPTTLLVENDDGVLAPVRADGARVLREKTLGADSSDDDQAELRVQLKLATEQLAKSDRHNQELYAQLEELKRKTDLRPVSSTIDAMAARTARQAAEQIRSHVRHEDGGAPATVDRWAILYVSALMRARGLPVELAAEVGDLAPLEVYIGRVVAPKDAPTGPDLVSDAQYKAREECRLELASVMAKAGHPSAASEKPWSDLVAVTAEVFDQVGQVYELLGSKPGSRTWSSVMLELEELAKSGKLALDQKEAALVLETAKERIVELEERVAELEKELELFPDRETANAKIERLAREVVNRTSERDGTIQSCRRDLARAADISGLLSWEAMMETIRIRVSTDAKHDSDIRAALDLAGHSGGTFSESIARMAEVITDLRRKTGRATEREKAFQDDWNEVRTILGASSKETLAEAARRTVASLENANRQFSRLDKERRDLRDILGASDSETLLEAANRRNREIDVAVVTGAAESREVWEALGSPPNETMAQAFKRVWGEREAELKRLESEVLRLAEVADPAWQAIQPSNYSRLSLAETIAELRRAWGDREAQLIRLEGEVLETRSILGAAASETLLEAARRRDRDDAAVRKMAEVEQTVLNDAWKAIRPFHHATTVTLTEAIAELKSNLADAEAKLVDADARARKAVDLLEPK